jgi:hypothetical protein
MKGLGLAGLGLASVPVRPALKLAGGAQGGAI